MPDLPIYLRPARIPSADEQRLLVRRAQAGDRRARSRVITATARFVVGKVVHMLRRSRLAGAHADDMVAAGLLGVDRAIDTFSEAHGVVFLTYASRWVVAYVQRELARQVSGGLRVPLLAAQRVALNGHSGTMEAQAVSTLSLDAPLGATGEAQLHDRLPDAGPGPAEQLERAGEVEAARRTLAPALARLPKRHRRVVEERLLGEGVTLDEVGQRMGLSRERVRQMETQALEKLGRALGSRLEARQMLRALRGRGVKGQGREVGYGQ